MMPSQRQSTEKRWRRYKAYIRRRFIVEEAPLQQLLIELSERGLPVKLVFLFLSLPESYGARQTHVAHYHHQESSVRVQIKAVGVSKKDRS